MTDAEVVQKALAAVRSGDREAASEFVHESFVWHIPGASPISGDIEGVDAWIAKLRRLLEAGLRPEPLGMLEGSGHVAVLQRNTAEVGQHRLDVRVISLFRIEDGKVARMDTYFADQPAAEAFWSRVFA